ncbi:uncharacterized protein LOC127844044 isoform X2 [Dreissena polymorpha]|uniref:Uncharacterized protein n=2 Tax=Dreissena polymorpha TaxID=45954 RepID=A0A9D4S1Z5_DREPO|nr:uncharacterized protein LOC127844044 isoform X2 [Dreissena polymorpha]XP_052229984.1 uncharacterized protein LOC127844044 isoform X2 [Dreissena polymorpha]KAH3887488.1 hypothetical protein DPMN_011505 [Dreissena polymorpha]
MQVAYEEVLCECSDDEMLNPGKLDKGTWQPRASDILALFDQLKDKKVLELSWKCPGRRTPKSDEPQEEESKVEEVKTPTKTDEHKPAIPNEFDFDEGPETKTVITPRRTPGSAPKSQKKVARMDKVLKDMMQQRKQQAAERDARKQAASTATGGAKSPRTNSGSPGRARIGSPAGSPRTPPSAGVNRMSPVRLPGDPITTTPLRAPLPDNTLLAQNRAVTSEVERNANFADSTTAGTLAAYTRVTSTVQSYSNHTSAENMNSQISVFSQQQPQDLVISCDVTSNKTVSANFVHTTSAVLPETMPESMDMS